MTGQQKKPPRPAWQRSKKLVTFIADLSRHGNVSKALKKAKCSRAWVYEKRQTDLEFAEAFADAKACGIEVLIDEAHRRAYDGVEEGVYYQGELVDTVQKFSDTLLMFLIKQSDPSYREHFQIDHANAGGRPFMFAMQLHPEVVAEHQAAQQRGRS